MKSNVPAPESREAFVIEYERAVSLCAAAGGDGRLTDPALENKLYSLYVSLLEGAKTANLTAILDLPGVVEKHFIDSLIPLKLMADRGLLPSRDGASAVDVGCGAGFPSLPVAAACDGTLFPSLTVCAVDGTGKKIAHVKRAAESAGLPGVKAIHGRAEELAAAGGPMRERFDLAAARAVASLPELLELCAPFVKVGGAVAAYKGPEDETAAASGAAKTLGLVLRDRIAYTLPGGDARTLVLYEKVKITPAAYPRKFAKIKSDPL